MTQTISTPSFSVPAQKPTKPIKASTRPFSSPSPSPSPPPSASLPANPPSSTCTLAPTTPSCPSSHPFIRPSSTPTPSQPPRIPANPQVKTRRRIYLSRHPSYCLSPDLELSHPLLYDRLVRCFQSAAEREAEGKKRGYARVLEAGLWRGEAVRGMGGYSEEYARVGRGIMGEDGRVNGEDERVNGEDGRVNGEDGRVNGGNGGNGRVNGNVQVRGEGDDRDAVMTRDLAGRSGEREDGVSLDFGGMGDENGLMSSDYAPTDREEGMRIWREQMEARFLRGDDEDFTYRDVDESEEFDDLGTEERNREDAWFAEEEEEWIQDSNVEGETGVQDF